MLKNNSDSKRLKINESEIADHSWTPNSKLTTRLSWESLKRWPSKQRYSRLRKADGRWTLPNRQ
jgi:hypothetical protein